MILFFTILYLIGLLSSIYLTYERLKNGEDFTIGDLFFILVISSTCLIPFFIAIKYYYSNYFISYKNFFSKVLIKRFY